MERIAQWDRPLLPATARWFNSSTSNSPIASILPNGLDFFDSAFAQRQAMAQSSIDREQLAAELYTSHQRRHAPQTVLDAVSSLKDENGFLTATGQQPGLCGGPLLTVYKIIQCINLARQLTKQSGQRVIPAFWNASEDHDLSEINTLNWFSRENAVQPFVWELEDRQQPYFTIPAGDFPVDGLAGFIEANSHPTEFLPQLLDDLRNASANGVSYADVFDNILWQWFGGEGLIILRPDAEYTRSAAVPIIKHEIENPAQSSLEINQMGDELQQHDMHAQIHKRDDRTAFFLNQKNKRIPLYIRENGFADDEGNAYTKDDLLIMLENEPSAFSPSAILRPVVQDAVYPTVAVVLGPNEMAYHALLHPLYVRHGIPRPCVVPRSGFTLLEPRMMKWMDQYGLELDDLHEHPTALLKRHVKESYEGADEIPKEELLKTVDTFFDVAIKRAQAVDGSIVNALEKNKGKIIKEIENSENVVLRKEAAKHETMQKHIEALQAFVFPNGQPQERVLNLLYFLGKYGNGILSDLLAISADLEHGSHTFIKIP